MSTMNTPSPDVLSAIPPTRSVGYDDLDRAAAAVFDGGAYGNPSTYTDDVIVDGRIITAGNYDSAALFGRTLASRVLGR